MIHCLFFCCSVAVVSDVCALSVTGGTSCVLALGGLRVGDDSGVKGLLSSGHILSLSLPGLEGWGLKSATVGEGESPWTSDLSDLIHFVQVKSGLFLWLTTWKEGNGSHGGGDGAGEGADCVPGDLLGWGFVGAVSSLGHHVWLKEAALKENVVLMKRLYDLGENTLSDLSADFNRVVSISKNFRLNNRSETILLADSSIASKSVGGLNDW